MFWGVGPLPRFCMILIFCAAVNIFCFYVLVFLLKHVCACLGGSDFLGKTKKHYTSMCFDAGLLKLHHFLHLVF